MILRILRMLRAPGYNLPTSWRMFWSQWIHKGYLWGWYSYETYSRYSRLWER